jgi:predicted NAD-dependent protein-ADP-ribosyltransferase YbiA (DUF1768 family)
MRVVLKPDVIAVIGESPDDIAALRAFAARGLDRVFALKMSDTVAFSLHDLGPRAEACATPINVISSNAAYAIIANLAHTPFELDGCRYASVEGFWQGLKTDDPLERARLAALHGPRAKAATKGWAVPERFVFAEREVRSGTADHWDLMYAACREKFRQNERARRVLHSTGTRPLQHRVRRDSRTIPGVVMADIWMRLRARLNDEDRSSA